MVQWGKTAHLFSVPVLLLWRQFAVCWNVCLLILSLVMYICWRLTRERERGGLGSRFSGKDSSTVHFAWTSAGEAVCCFSVPSQILDYMTIVQNQSRVALSYHNDSPSGPQLSTGFSHLLCTLTASCPGLQVQMHLAQAHTARPDCILLRLAGSIASCPSSQPGMIMLSPVVLS